MFDIKAAEAQAKKEIAEEKAKLASTKIKAKLAQIDAAKKVVQNLEHEYEILLREISKEV